MAWSFDNNPNSLASLARNSRELAAQSFLRVEIDIIDGTIIVDRSVADDSTGAAFIMFGNIFDDSDPSWKYLAGSENVAFFLAVKEFANTTSLPVQRIFLEFENGALINFAAFKPNGSTTGALNDQVDSALDGLFNPAATVNNGLDQFLYGDTDRKNVSGAPTLINDTLFGANGHDTIIGLLGNDILDGDKGNDELYGGFGNDVLTGGLGNDLLYGQENKDRLLGEEGDDYLDGGLGADFMRGGPGDDTYVVDNAGDVVDDRGSTTDNDVVLVPLFLSYVLPKNIEDAELSGRDNSALTGNAVGNELAGNDGKNKLSGEAGKDEIYGGDGNDTIDGGPGGDTLAGGSGLDVFDFNPGDVGLGGSRDQVTDFQPGADDINLRDIDANTNTGGNQNFKLAGSFTGVPGQLIFANGFLSGDVNGDRKADFRIQLFGVSSIGGADLVM